MSLRVTFVSADFPDNHAKKGQSTIIRTISGELSLSFFCWDS